MKNGDMPANSHAKWDNDFDKVVQQWSGLSKREHFAAMAMQGLTSAGGDWSWGDLAECSVSIADALLKALEEE